MRKALLNDAVQLSKKVGEMSRDYHMAILSGTVTILTEDFVGLFDEYKVEPLDVDVPLVYRLITEYEGVKVISYVRRNEVEKYGIQI